jgi:hypothetical protein
MAKEKLNRKQNEHLGRITDLNEKFDLLEQWLKDEQISQELYNSTINKLINRAMKNAKPSFDLDDRTDYRLVIEAEIQELIDRLRTKLNLFLSNRDKEKAKISSSDMELYKHYVECFPQLKSKVNRLLIIGLRYPDIKINKLAEEYVLKYKFCEQIKFTDMAFWLMLWEDGNLVPMNAVRLMLVKTENSYKLNHCFNSYLIKELLPLVKFQRDKEIIRLRWAQSLKNPEKKKTEIERKQKRLDAFNCLLEILQKS